MNASHTIRTAKDSLAVQAGKAGSYPELPDNCQSIPQHGLISNE
jgi:hypothetical protein